MEKCFLLFLSVLQSYQDGGHSSESVRFSHAIYPFLFNIFPSFRIEPGILSTCLLDNSVYTGFGEFRTISLTIIVSLYLSNGTFTGILMAKDREQTIPVFITRFLVDIVTSNKVL